VATAVLKSFYFDKIIFYYEKYLLPPGHPEAQIRNKIFRAWVCHPDLSASDILLKRIISSGLPGKSPQA
jgi:hypothetical protein